MHSADAVVLQDILERRAGFGHREHLELAWSYLRRHSVEDASEVMASAIRHVAKAHGDASKYHDTMTRAWLHLVAVHMQRWGARSFEEFLDRNRDLLDRGVIEHFYSRELLMSPPARAAFAGPDVRRLPALA